MKQRPNVIYVLADDMGYGDISALNENCVFETPNFERAVTYGKSDRQKNVSNWSP